MTTHTLSEQILPLSDLFEDADWGAFRLWDAMSKQENKVELAVSYDDGSPSSL